MNSFQKIFLNPYLSTVDFSHKFFIQDAVNQCCSVAGFPLGRGRTTALSSNRPGFVSLFFSAFSVKGIELIWGYSSQSKFLLISSLISGWCSVEKQMKKYLGRDKDSAWELWSCYYPVSKKQVAVCFQALTWKTGENVGLEVSLQRMELERFSVGWSGRRFLLSPSLLGIEQWVSPERVSGVSATLELCQVRYCHPSWICTVSIQWRWHLNLPLLKAYIPKIVTDGGGHRASGSHFLGKELLGLIRLL